MRIMNMLKRFTVWDNLRGLLRSQYGLVSYEEWCEREAIRLSRGLGQPVVARRRKWKGVKQVCVGVATDKEQGYDDGGDKGGAD